MTNYIFVLALFLVSTGAYGREGVQYRVKGGKAHSPSAKIELEDVEEPASGNEVKALDLYRRIHAKASLDVMLGEMKNTDELSESVKDSGLYTKEEIDKLAAWQLIIQFEAFELSEDVKIKELTQRYNNLVKAINSGKVTEPLFRESLLIQEALQLRASSLVDKGDSNSLRQAVTYTEDINKLIALTADKTKLHPYLASGMNSELDDEGKLPLPLKNGSDGDSAIATK